MPGWTYTLFFVFFGCSAARWGRCPTDLGAEARALLLTLSWVAVGLPLLWGMGTTLQQAVKFFMSMSSLRRPTIRLDAYCVMIINNDSHSALQ
ncbi:hypothetical protein PYR66_10505 [Klebsiella aerogenes]|nr:hypothetical protein PYR66_10505 [Klebsiella aerogenes]